MIKIFIKNLAWKTTDEGLKKAFERFGSVNDANIARDRETGRSRGFGFVEMEYGQAMAAIEAMDGAVLDGRVLSVSEARLRGDRANREYRGGVGNSGVCAFPPLRPCPGVIRHKDVYVKLGCTRDDFCAMLLDEIENGITSEYSGLIVDAIADKVAEDILGSADQEEWNVCDASLGVGRVILRRFGVSV
jgi:hypothetical protein